ncbi:hypothetical protein KAI31_00935 [Candidatus Bathyarchaeota archaeon]|nr:hypothetical protein [Candidatus Bathyarchaeota archaeon]
MKKSGNGMISQREKALRASDKKRGCFPELSVTDGQVIVERMKECMHAIRFRIVQKCL